MPWELVATGGNQLGGLAVDIAGQNNELALHVVSSGTGEVMKVEPGDDGGPGTLAKRSPTGGFPNALAFDQAGALFVADFAHKSIVSQPVDETEFQVLVGDYEGAQFYGPNSLCFDNNGTLFFTDSGPMGDTSLANPKGSVFCVSHEDQLLKPLALHCLAHPSGIVTSQDGSFVFVAETMANRVLRFVKRPNGVFHCSVYHQFSGGFGPTALACDNQNRLYVARFDFAGAGSAGKIAVLGEEGRILNEIDAPGPEVLGMMVAMEKDGSETIYISEQSASSVHSTPVATFFDEGGVI